MRIVSGKYRGRAINPPKNLRARPTTDFAKENLFNVLGNLVDFEECDVLDLFAGTGSISYEFASRGVHSVTSVEINPVHYNFIKKTAADLGIDNLFEAVRPDLFGRALRSGGQRRGHPAGTGTRFTQTGWVSRFRTFEKHKFFVRPSLLAIKKLRKRAIFFLQKVRKKFGDTDFCTTFAFAISKRCGSSAG